MSVSEMIRIILIKRNMKIKDLADKLGYKRNNFSMKLKYDNFSERELKNIAEALNCRYEIAFYDLETGEKL